MRFLLFIWIFLIGQTALLGQSAEEEVIRLKQSMGMEAVEAVSQEGQNDLQPGTLEEGEEAEVESREARTSNWNLSVGTSFSYMQGLGSGMGFYAAPTYTLPLTSRWSLHAGMVASTFTMMNAPTGLETQGPSGFSSLSLFAAASYQATERLVIHGAGVKQLITSPASPMTSYPIDNFSLGATYKLGDNITIGASVQVRHGYGYGYGAGSPYYNSSFGSPYSSPFGSPFGSPYSSPFGW